MATKEHNTESSEKELEFVKQFRFMDIVAHALQEVQEGADETAITSALRTLQDKFVSCDSTLKALPGGNLTQRNQIAEIKRLKENLENKQFLLQQLYSKHDLISRVLAQRAIPEARPVDGVDTELVFPSQENNEGLAVVTEDDPMMGLGM
ncbi:RNA polymerase II transcription mediator complex subunit 9 [Gracilaria domingensis]|nr:RNA polymerase II transcription mediator complex subunit 9 [Gracilaria domingensis]